MEIRQGHISQAVPAFFDLLWQADCLKARVLSSESGGKGQGKQPGFYDPITQAESSLKTAEEESWEALDSGCSESDEKKLWVAGMTSWLC